jgi:hypothetical protein
MLTRIHRRGTVAGRCVRAVALPTSPLLARALPRVDWSDAYAVEVPAARPHRHPQEWADAIVGSPPPWVRLLFAVRELLVPVVGIERGTGRAFETVSWRPDEVLLGTDQRHLAYRASVLLQPGRVVLSTVVDVRSRRGRAYCLLVRRIHPLVVRAMLARAARTMAAAP